MQREKFEQLMASLSGLDAEQVLNVMTRLAKRVESGPGKMSVCRELGVTPLAYPGHDRAPVFPEVPGAYIPLIQEVARHAQTITGTLGGILRQTFKATDPDLMAMIDLDSLTAKNGILSQVSLTLFQNRTEILDRRQQNVTEHMKRRRARNSRQASRGTAKPGKPDQGSQRKKSSEAEESRAQVASEVVPEDQASS